MASRASAWCGGRDGAPKDAPDALRRSPTRCGRPDATERRARRGTGRRGPPRRSGLRETRRDDGGRRKLDAKRFRSGPDVARRKDDRESAPQSTRGHEIDPATAVPSCQLASASQVEKDGPRQGCRGRRRRQGRHRQEARQATNEGPLLQAQVLQAALGPQVRAQVRAVARQDGQARPRVRGGDGRAFPRPPRRSTPRALPGTA